MSQENVAVQQEGGIEGAALTFDAAPGADEEHDAGITFGDADSDAESEGEGDDAAAATEGATAVSNVDFAAVDKHDAKNVLDKTTYKAWKKWYRERKENKGKSSKDDKKKEKEAKKKADKDAHNKKKEKKEKKDKREKRSKRETAGSDDYGEDSLDHLAAAGGGGGGRATITMRVPAKKKVSGAEMDAKWATAAKDLVENMKRAAAADTAARANRMPPLNRLAIRPGVINVAQRPFMHQFLCEAGFLDEIAAWLCDTTSRELGPLDLRTSALDLLLGFDFEGVTSVRKKQLQAAMQRKGDDGDVDIGYEGVTSDQLRSCDLGGAVNFVRTAPQETRDNRIKATTLLERMSRTFHDEHDDEEVVGGGAKWPMMNDRSVASPFETLKTTTEAFMTACIRVDPEDPNSYLKQPPKRFPRSFISGLAGVGRQKRDRDDDN